jgi:hypothetical protein
MEGVFVRLQVHFNFFPAQQIKENSCHVSGGQNKIRRQE